MMDIKDIILNGKESVNVEFKESTDYLTKDVFSTICAMLNTCGGYCVLGVKDNGMILGINPENLDKIKTDFANSVNNKSKLNPPIPLMLNELYIDDKIVLYTYVPESSEIHKLNDRFVFMRSEEGDKNITDNQYAMKNLYLRKSGMHSEDIIYKNLRIDDFDLETIEYAKKLAISKDPTSNWNRMSAYDILNSSMFYKEDRQTGEKGYTLAALLLFGKSLSIINNLGWYKVDCIKRVKDEIRFDDRFVCEDNLIKSYEKLIDYVCRNIDKPFYIKDYKTVDVFTIIVRELVSNILIHRNFLNELTTKIVIYKNRIEVTNPNIPKSFEEVDISDIEPYSKNPIIARVFRKIGYADELGSGFSKIYDICSKVLDSNVEIEDKDIFSLVIHFSPIDYKNTDDFTKKIIDFIKLNGSINNIQIRELLGIEKTYAVNLLNKLCSNNVLYREGKGKATIYKLY